MTTIRFEDGKWIEPEEGDENNNNIVMDGMLIQVCDIGKKRLKNDLDFAIIVGGDVGSGKSNLGRLVARYISDEKFHPKTHIVQDADDIEKVLTNAKKGEAVLFDEASGIFASTDTMTKKTKYAQQVLDVCRQANLCLIIIAPGFHRLTYGVAVERAECFIRTYMVKGTHNRGPFAFYGRKNKEKLYQFAKKNYGSHKGVRPKFRGKVGEDKTFNPEYRKVKDETFKKVLSSFSEEKKKVPTPTQVEQDYKYKLVLDNPEMSSADLAKILNCTPRWIQRIRKERRSRIIERI